MSVMSPAPIDQQEDEKIHAPPSNLTDSHQTKKVVAQSETVSTAENQPGKDPLDSNFKWEIKDFTRLNTKEIHSEAFAVGGFEWQVLIFPKGNNADSLSMYLVVADAQSLPYGWSRYAQFSLEVTNKVYKKYSIRKDTQYQFNERERSWGFVCFMPLGELYDPARGFLVRDTLEIVAKVAVYEVTDYFAYDSKKETGHVGLKNQGGTCYLNALLQTLYHIPYFRKAVYHMPTTEVDMPTASIPLALQSLFYELQYSDSSVATKELTKSFNWDTYDSFMQYDVLGVKSYLCEKLEDKMKGTAVEGTIQKLLEGHLLDCIQYSNSDNISARKESFCDLQLDVKGCRDVYASFDKYVKAEQYGIQVAKKLFIDFPPVLQLKLNIFEYDSMRDTMVKINDRYEFPLELDLDQDGRKYLLPDANTSVRNRYTLHSVLGHSGGRVNGGH